MTPQRLQELIAAYGAEPARWPDGERAMAQDYLTRHPEARDLLEAARTLDGALDAWVIPPVRTELRQRVLSGAPSAGVRLSWPRLWLSGAGLATACAVGALVGAVVIEPALGGVPGDHSETASLLSDGVRVMGLPLETGAPG